MKIKTLSLLAGVGAPLIMTAASSAGFVGLKTTIKDNPFGLLVVNVYAIFDRPGEDHMIAVAGTPLNPLSVVVEGGTFYNHAFGVASNQPPDPALIAVFPELAFDSFVTIGKKTLAGSDLTITPGMALIGGSVWSFDDAGWAVTPENPQGNPFDPVNSFPGTGQILIAQFSTVNGTEIHGTLLLKFVGSAQAYVGFTSIPAPGALALLGAAGLIGTRRRRRHRRE